MRIGILSRNPALYSTRRLAQAIWARGHQAQIIDTTAIAVHLGADGTPPMLTANPIGPAATSPLPPLDAIIPRIGTSVTFYGLAVVRQFETAGVFSAASSDAISRSRDKLHSNGRRRPAGGTAGRHQGRRWTAGSGQADPWHARTRRPIG